VRREIAAAPLHRAVGRRVQTAPEHAIEVVLNRPAESAELMIPLEGASETGRKRGKPC